MQYIIDIMGQSPYGEYISFFEIFGGVIGFDVLLTVSGACRALTKCSLNNWSKQEMQKLHTYRLIRYTLHRPSALSRKSL